MRKIALAAQAAAAFALLEDLLRRPGVFVTIRAEAQPLERLEARAEKLHNEIEAICAAADHTERDLTAEEKDKAKKLKADLDALDEDIALRKSLLPRSAGRRADPQAPVAVRAADPTHGFRNIGEFAKAVRMAALNPSSVDKRIVAAAPSTAGNEGTGADGGFIVPPDFRNSIWQKVMGDGSLAERCDQNVTAGNSITIPADESTPWDSSGITAYWESELAATSPSKPVFSLKTSRLNKMTALVPVSEELLEDAPMLDGYLRMKAPQKMRAKLNTAIVRGTGAGQPLGILTSPSLITQDQAVISPVQGASTFVYENVVDMWARLYSECRGNAVWLINQSVEPQLNAMRFVTNSASPVPAYMPAGGLSGSPYGTLLGRPVVPVQPCSALGTVGDVILVDLTQYMIVTKGQDIRTDVSMHLYFDAAAMAYRFIMRVSGQPWWGSTISPENGANTLGWAVALSSTRA
jgi:HK97 family phage major capsid protein